MRLAGAARLGLCFLLLAPVGALAARITIPCAEKILDPKLSASLQEFLDALTDGPLSELTHEISARPADGETALLTADSDRLAKYLQSMTAWRERVDGALYHAEESRPHVWFYPASGYDLASAVWMADPKVLQSKTSVFVLVDQQMPFVSENVSGKLPSSIEFSAENLSDNADSKWAYSVTHRGLLRTRAQSLGGLLPATLSRMRSYYGEAFKVEKIFAIRDRAFLPPDRVYPLSHNLAFLSQISHPTHGVMTFRIGDGPAQYAIFVHGRVATDSAKLVIGTWGANAIPLNLKIFGMLNGVVVKGSQGVLAPLPQTNHSRDLLLAHLAHNSGILYEGNHQNPLPEHHEPDPDPEVTTEFGFIRGSTRPIHESLTTTLGTHTTSRLEDWSYKWSYYDGARATRFLHPVGP